MSDHDFFNCSQDYEINYIASLYKDSDAVKKFLKEQCANGTIKYFTHSQVYKLIKDKLGFDKK